MNDDWISLQSACALLDVSRPTLNKYRKEARLTEHRLGNRVFLSKLEIIEKLILPRRVNAAKRALLVTDPGELRQVQRLVGVYDLRTIKAIDAYGVVTLLCDIKSRLKEDEHNRVYLLVDHGWACIYLKSIGFFAEVERGNQGRVYAKTDEIPAHPQSRDTVILPLHQIGYRGAEKKILDQLYDPLLKQGFSETYCGYIGWIIGELCDNAHTHSHGGPCYMIIESLPTESTETRFLVVAMGDTGIGVAESLQSNPDYSALPEERLLPMAFLREVSRMETHPKRGKGLNDVIGIAKGNRSWLRVESNGQGLFFNFGEEDEISRAKPPLPTRGTRFCLVLIDSAFERIPRPDVDDVIMSFLGRE